MPASTGLLLASGILLFCTLYIQQNFRSGAWALALGCWLAAMLFFLLCCHQLDRENADTTPLALPWRRNDTAILAALLLLALAVRIVQPRPLPHGHAQ